MSPSARTRLATKKGWVSRLIPDMFEVGVRRKFVFWVWGAVAAGLLATKLWPVLRNLWAVQKTPLSTVFTALSIGQVVFALVISFWYAAATESKGEHTDAAGKARWERLRKEGTFKYFMAGIGLIETIDKVMGGL